MNRLFASAMGVTFMAMALGARADEAREPAPPAQAPVDGATPLATRPSAPLSLAPVSDGSHPGYKLFAGVVVVLGAGVWLRKKRGAKGAAPASRIDVLGRASVGVRSELVVVEVDRTRLLVGVTPGAIQTLAVLDSVEPVAAPIEEEAAAAVEEKSKEEEEEHKGDRLRSLLDVGRALSSRLASPPAPAPAPRLRASKTKLANVAGQAKGLLLALEEPLEGGEPPARNGGRSAERSAARNA